MTKPIGELLIEQGVLTKEQLNTALETQRTEKQKKRIGEILIGLGIVTEADIAAALSTQFGFPYLAPQHLTFNRDICALVPGDAARKQLLIPLDKINDILYVIMADPSDENSIQALEKTTKHKVRLFISTPSEIQNAIIKQYGETSTSDPK